MKYLFFICALISATIVKAQDLRTYIPYDAAVVGSINGNNILESVTISELNNTVAGKEILKYFSITLGCNTSDFNSFGVNTRGIMYFYYKNIDSLFYTATLVPLKNGSALAGLMKADSVEFIDKGRYKMRQIGNSSFVVWDNQKLVFVTGFKSEMYFDNYDFSEIEAELESSESSSEDVAASQPFEEMGYHEMPYFNNYQLQIYANNYYQFCEDFKRTATGYSAVGFHHLQNEAERVAELAEAVVRISTSDAKLLDELMRNKVHFLNEAVKRFSDAKLQEQARELIEEATFYSSDFEIVESKEKKNVGGFNYHYAAKEALEERWTKHQLDFIMAPVENSILTHRAYLDQVDSKAIANLWNGSISNLFYGMYKDIYSAFKVKPDDLNEMLKTYGALSSNLYFEGQQARISLDINMNNPFAKSYKRMLDQKINKKFFKYINEDKLLGYISYNINVQNTLEEYPQLMAQSYAGALGLKSKDEVDLGVALFSLLLDEEAIAEVMRGDMLFVFSDISEREITYTDYEYDEDYKYQKVEKTKMEKMPDFLFMASTKESALTNKLIAYLIKKNKIVEQNGYYKIEGKSQNLPLDIYFAIKNDIFFLATSAADMSAIINNNFKAKLSGKHKKILKQGNYAAFFNGKQFGERFPLDSSMREKQRYKVQYALDNAADFYIKSSKMKNNNMHSEMIMEIPNGHKNALAYMLTFFDRMNEEKIGDKKASKPETVD